MRCAGRASSAWEPCKASRCCVGGDAKGEGRAGWSAFLCLARARGVRCRLHLQLQAQ